jgi:hypothetical protein
LHHDAEALERERILERALKLFASQNTLDLRNARNSLNDENTWCG